MIKKVLFAAAFLIASPTFVFGQDIFFSFEEAAATDATTLVDATSASAYIFSNGTFGFDAADIDIAVGGDGMIEITGGEGFNPTFNAVGKTRFDSAVVTGSGAAGNFFAVNVAQNGVNPALGPLFDPGFNAAIGADGAVLLARVDFNILGAGVSTLDMSLGGQGVLQLPDVVLNPAFGSGTLTTEASAVPEPSAAMLVILGAVGLVARRRRA